jgi:predicted NBD/HSP70 family sugar kinase
VGFPLADQLQVALDGCPVLVGHDATAAAVAEHWTGSWGSESVFATLFMATGIGAGVMVRGSVHRGAGGMAGEIGHVCVDPQGPTCWCGARGCLEALAGPRTVVAAGLERFGPGSSDDLGLTGDPDRVRQDFAVLARAAVRGHPGAVELLTRSAGYLGIAARSLVNVLDLDTLVLTGPGFTVAGPLYAGVIAEHVATALRAALGPIEVRLSANIADAAAVGAVALVLRSELTPDPLVPLPSAVV